MLQGNNKGIQEGEDDPQIPISRETLSEEGKQTQEEMQQKIVISEGVPLSASEEKNSVVTPAFGFSASRAQYSEQVPQHHTSAFTETNQNSSHLSLTTQRPFQSLLTPTLFMKSVGQVGGCLPLKQSFQSSAMGGGSGNIGELNDCQSNAANSQMNANNDAEIQRMIVDQHSTDAAARGFTVVGTLKHCIQTPYENKFESPMQQKSIAQRSLSFMQQQVKQSPVKIIMQRQQTTPAKEGKSVGHHDDANASTNINKENFNTGNISNLTHAHQVQDQSRDDQNLKMLHMQMFDSPDKRAHHLKNQMQAQNESPAANSCQSAQIAFANLNLSHTAGKYQSALNQSNCRIQSGAILGGLIGGVAASATDTDHSTSKYDEYIMKQHLTQSPMFKGAFVPYSPKGSPFQARVLRDNHAVITSLNMKMEAHAQDNDILPMQIMSNHNDAERQQYLVGGDASCEQQRIFNPDLDEEALNQLKSLGPTPQRPGAISKSGEKELKARRLFQSPPKESVSNPYPQNVNRSSFVDDRNIGSVSQNNLQTASISSQVGLKQLSGSKTQNRKTYNYPLEEIAEEPQRNSDMINNHSLNYPLFSNHHHPFDSMMISNNSAQLRLNSMLEGPNSGDSGRKMRSYISSIVPEQNNYSGANNGQTDFTQNHNPLHGGRLVSRLDNEFTMAENQINNPDDHQYSSFINPLSFNPGSIEQNHFSFNLHPNDLPQQHQHSLHPQFQLGSYATNTANGQQENVQLLKKFHHIGGAETSSSQMRIKHSHGVGSRNLTHNFQQINSSQIYEGKKTFTTMSFGSFQNDQMQHPVFHHQCKCGANYQLLQPIVKPYQPQNPHAIQNTYGGDAQSMSSNGGVSQASIRHVAHTGNRLRHNHHQHHLMSGAQRSLSMKVGQRNLGNNSLPPHPHHHRVPKGTSLHKQAARQAAQSGMMPQFDLKNSNFINTNIQMNVYIPSPTEQQQQAHSSQSSQSKLNNHLNNEGLINDAASVHNEVSEDMEGCIVNTEDANNAIQNSNAANKIGSFNQMQSMSSNKKNTSGLKKRLYPQFLNSSNKKVNATPSTNSCLQNSTSKSNQKSNMKKKIQELNNQQQISNFDVNHSSQQINPTLGDDSKFQTPKGPNIFHHQLSVKANSSSGMMQGMNFSTPDDDKEMGGSSTQKTHQAVFQHSIANHQRHQLLLSSSGPHSDMKIHNIMESCDKNQPIIRVTCNCKKSKCLKLYCDCFALGLGCGPDCNCQDCCNQDGNEERKGAMESILERNPQAFKPKIPDDTGSHTKGCRCKKSGCQKKYCECYQSGVLCSDRCVCDGCLNCDEHSKLPKSGFVPLRIPRDPEDQMMVEEFRFQQVTAFKEPVEEKQAPPEIITIQKFEQVENQEMENSFSNLKVNDSNQQNHQQTYQQEEPSTTKKSRGNRSIAQDLEKLLLSNDKNQGSPAEEIVDNLEAKHSSRKRRAIDLNSSQILQHQTQLTSTPIAKKTKQQISQSSAKASNKNLVNRVALMEVQQIMNEPSVQQISQMATPSSGKKASSKQSEMKKTPIKPIQMMSQNQEDAAMATNAPSSAAKQQEQQTAQQSHKQQTASSQPAAAAAANVTSCITTRSKRKQLEAATSLSDQKPPRNL